MDPPPNDGDVCNSGGDGNEDDKSASISEPASEIKFQPLKPLPEKFPEPMEKFTSNPHPPRSDSDVSKIGNDNDTKTNEVTKSNSKEGALFINNIQDPVAASKALQKTGPEDENSLSTQQQLSHTPPSISTSYETKHFGKRPRSGVSSIPN